MATSDYYPTCQAEVPFLVEDDLGFCSKVNCFLSIEPVQVHASALPFLVEDLQFCSKVDLSKELISFEPPVLPIADLERKSERINDSPPKRSEISPGRFASSRSRYDKNL